jgi:stearoyl-CoA desaturase (delta-9 desaturase)
MLGESLHNNHHKNPKANFGDKWYEFDPVYPVIVILGKLKVIKIKK